MATATFTLRAVDETKAAFASVQNSLQRIDNDVRSIGKGFRIGNVVKDLVRGFGIGSGFQIIQSTFEAINQQRKDELETAQFINKEQEKQLALLKQIFALRQTPEEQRQTKLKDLEQQMADVEKERQMLVDEKRRTFTPLQKPGSAFRTREENLANIQPKVRDLYQFEQKRLAELNTEYQKLRFEIDSLNKASSEMSSDRAESERLSDQTRKLSAYTKGLEAQEAAFEQLVSTQRKANDETEQARERAKAAAEKIADQAEAYRKLGDPLRVYSQQLEEVNKLEREGALTVVDASMARDQIVRNRTSTERQMLQDELDDLYGWMDDIGAEAEALAQAADEIGFAFSSAFEDAILSGQKFSDVLRSLGQDVLRVFTRLAITNPLINSVFGSLPGFQALPAIAGFRAKGGPVSMGSAYVVGEEGPELFVPKSSGNIIANKASGSMAGSMGGVTVNYNIAAGVTKGELVPILEAERKRLKAEIPDMVRRGGAYRAAFA